MKDSYVDFNGFVEFDESETDDFKSLQDILQGIRDRYIGSKVTRDNFSRLNSELECAVLEYKENHPESFFRMRPEHKYAYSEKDLSVDEIASLHEKYCEYNHHSKKYYTYLEVNNMLFDLQVVGQVNGYQKFYLVDPLSICNREVNVGLRVFDYI